MSDKKRKDEDSRDVFEKALDWAVPLAGGATGAVIGGKALSRILSGGKRNVLRLQSEEQKAIKRADRDPSDENVAARSRASAPERCCSARRASSRAAGRPPTILPAESWRRTAARSCAASGSSRTGR